MSSTTESPAPLPPPPSQSQPKQPPPPPPAAAQTHQYNYYHSPYYNPYQYPPNVFNPYMNQMQQQQRNVSFGSNPWNRNPNNPPPPPPKQSSFWNQSNKLNSRQVEIQKQVKSHSLILQRHNNCENAIKCITTNNIKQMVSSSLTSATKEPSSSITQNSQSIPAAFIDYCSRCLERFKQLPPHIATKQNRDKLQKQLKGRKQEATANESMYTIDWSKEVMPPFLRHLMGIKVAEIESIISPRKRKANFEWNSDYKMARKVAKVSTFHRVKDSPPPSFVSIKPLKHRLSTNGGKDSDDMSCSDSPSVHMSFKITRNKEVMPKKLKFHNAFSMDDDVDSSSSRSDEEMFVISKGRGFESKKMNKKNKKKKSKFSWNGMDGIESLNTSKNKQISSHMNEVNRILERKKRFEAKQNNATQPIAFKHATHYEYKQANEQNLSKDMQQRMEWHAKRVIGTNTKVEKDYFRLTSEPNPNEVRTLDTLKKAFSLLMIRWKTKNKRDYLYVGGQFKSLRQDLRVQHIRNDFTVNVYEENARICLEVGDLSEYNQCQGQLKELYAEMGINGTNFIEFLSLNMLYEAVTKNWHAISCIIKMEKQCCKEKEIQNTLKIITAIQRTDYFTFFRLYAKLRYHGRCILDQIIYKIRYQALCRISVSYCPSTYPIPKLAKCIGFEDVNECVTYLKNTGCVLQRVKGNALVLNCKASRGKIKEFVPKSEDDELGVTHGSVYHSKDQDETSIAKFLLKNK